MLDNVPAAPKMQSCHLWGSVVQQGCILRGDGVQRQVDCLGEVAQLQFEILVKIKVLWLDVPAEAMDATMRKHLLNGVGFGPELHALLLCCRQGALPQGRQHAATCSSL